MLMKKVVDIVASRRGVLVEDITQPCQKHEVVDAKMISASILFELGYSYTAIGSVMKCSKGHARQLNLRCTDLLCTDEIFKRDYDFVMAHFEGEHVCPTCLRALSEREVIELYVATHPNPKSNGTH